jgi:cell division septation protein DedD
VFDPNDSQVMYAADRFSGLYRSTDGGMGWMPINVGLRTRAINALAMSSDGQHLYAGTEGEGVFRLDLSGQPPQPVPTPALPSTPTPVPTDTPPLATPTPTAVSAVPTSTPPPAQPTAPPEAAPTPTPEPSKGQGICGGVAAVPLALVGLIWGRCRRR